MLLRLARALAWCSVLVVMAPSLARAEPAAFRVEFDPAIRPEPYSGRVYVVVVPGPRRPGPEPWQRLGSWWSPPMTFATDAAGVEAGGAVVLSDDALWHPVPPSAIPPGRYLAQAVARVNPDSPRPGWGAGDLISESVEFESDRDGGPGTVRLRLTRATPTIVFREPANFRLVEVVSPLLSAFHGREYRLRAGVVLPADWSDDPSITHPVIYAITGFGGDHRSAPTLAGMRPADARVEPIFVVPDATNSRGHSVFADSTNNGPWGRALVEELIPHIERTFHGAGAEHRYVTGVSSGGWAALWLQITYPDQFRSCWAHCPDPVDFRDFQRINLYEPGANMYRDAGGARRPLARRGDEVMIWYDDFCRAERVIGAGGQIGSFEAVFSPRGADGEPRPLFDRDTGDVDPVTARAWEAYDIRLVLERNWATRGPRLAGKLHVFAGELDTFYLEGAVRLLKESLDRLGSDAEVVIEPGMAHTLHRGGHAGMYRAIDRDWFAQRR